MWFLVYDFCLPPAQAVRRAGNSGNCWFTACEAASAPDCPLIPAQAGAWCSQAIDMVRDRYRDIWFSAGPEGS
jgi:hypothetical protein